MDPCEKEPTDVLDNMVPQDREEITVNAQVAFCLDWAWLKIVAWQPSLSGGGVLLQENHEATPGREQLHHLLGGSSETKSLFSFQQALRLLAFRQVHKILGMEPLPTSKASTRNRKRRLDGSNAGEGEGEGKKDKKEEADSAWPLLLFGRLVECPN